MAPIAPFRSASYAGLAVDEIGRPDDRPALILLHGLTFNRRMWHDALSELEAIEPGRHAIAIDLPGHGESPDAPSYSLATTVECIHDAIVEAGIESPVLVGHSASAATVALYAAQFPTCGIVEVEGTFVVAPFAELVQSMAPELRGLGFHAAWERISSGVFRLDEVSSDVRSFVEATSWPRQEVVLGYWQDLLEVPPAQLTAWVAGAAGVIRRSGIPVTSVVGADPSPAEVAWCEAHLPAIRTLVWPGSGHFPHLAHPRRFAELLASTSARAARAAAAGAPTSAAVRL